MGWIVLWICMGVVGYMIGNPKGEGRKGVILGLLLGPIGLLIVALSTGNRKQCPKCKSRIHKDATVCPRCHTNLAAATSPTRSRTCPFCAENVKLEAVVCEHCGRDLPQTTLEYERAKTFLSSLDPETRDQMEKYSLMTERKRRDSCWDCHGKNPRCQSCDLREEDVRRYVESRARVSVGEK